MRSPVCGMNSAGSCEGLSLLGRLLSALHVVKCRGHHALECSKLAPPNPHPVLVGGVGNTGGRQEATIV